MSYATTKTKTRTNRHGAGFFEGTPTPDDAMAAIQDRFEQCGKSAQLRLFVHDFIYTANKRWCRTDIHSCWFDRGWYYMRTLWLLAWI
jgi:hypothetical protein